MTNAHLAVYLTDHRAGSVAAVELLEHLEASHAGTPIAPFAAALRSEIEADIRDLEGLMSRVGTSSSLIKNAGAWITAKVAELKLQIDDPSGGPLRLLESLESVAIGIEGKRALWIGLSTAVDLLPALAGMDYGDLIRRAEAQRSAVEEQRLAAVKAVVQSS